MEGRMTEGWTDITAEAWGGTRRIALVVPLFLALTACPGSPPKSAGSDAPVSYAVPVAVGCIATGGKPAAPTTLKQRYTREQWDAMPPGAKSQAVAAQGGKHMNFEDESAAATSTCR